MTDRTLRATRGETGFVWSRRGFVSVVALWLAACAKPVPPTVRPKSVSVVAVRPAGLEVTLDLDVYNPNGFPLFVNSVNGTLEVGGGVELGRAAATPASPIAAESTSSVTSQLLVGWTNLSALAPYLVSQAPVDYRFRGVAAIGGDRVNVSVPFELQGSLTRQQLLEIGLSGLKP